MSVQGTRVHYPYAVLEAEARLACLAMGLDPALGLLHADLRARDSLALDLMEPVRPAVDALVLDLARAHALARRLLRNTAGCLPRAPAPRGRLAATGSRWAHELSPVAEWLAREFLDSWAQPPENGGGPVPRLSRRVQDVPTPLTQERRSRAQGIHQRTERAAPRRATVTGRCPVCGHRRSSPTSGRCPSCVAAHRLECVAHAVATRVQKRALGHDYTRAGKRSLSSKQRANKRAEAAWRAAHPEGADPEAYRREILPGLKGVRTVKLHRAFGIACQRRFRSARKRRRKVHTLAGGDTPRRSGPPAGGVARKPEGGLGQLHPLERGSHRRSPGLGSGGAPTPEPIAPHIIESRAHHHVGGYTRAPEPHSPGNEVPSPGPNALVYPVIRICMIPHRRRSRSPTRPAAQGLFRGAFGGPRPSAAGVG